MRDTRRSAQGPRVLWGPRQVHSGSWSPDQREAYACGPTRGIIQKYLIPVRVQYGVNRDPIATRSGTFDGFQGWRCTATIHILRWGLLAINVSWQRVLPETEIHAQASYPQYLRTMSVCGLNRTAWPGCCHQKNPRGQLASTGQLFHEAEEDLTHGLIHSPGSEAEFKRDFLGTCKRLSIHLQLWSTSFQGDQTHSAYS
jgi:hypothetical protein